MFLFLAIFTGTSSIATFGTADFRYFYDKLACMYHCGLFVSSVLPPPPPPPPPS